MGKILAITDIHYGQSKESRNHPGFYRQNSERANTELENISQYIPNDIDVFIQMGDLVRSTHGEINQDDTKNFIKINQTLSKISPKSINIAGNHDTELQDNSNSQIKITETSDCNILVINAKDPWKLNNTEIDNFKNLSKNNTKPLIIFTHIPIFPINQKDNFYFDNDPKQCFNNYQQIGNLLNPLQKVFIISGHFHWLSSTERSPNIRQITLPAFSENIITNQTSEIHPCIYNIIETNKTCLTIKSYSRQFCFGSLEYNLE